jgi:hypothetical protein
MVGFGFGGCNPDRLGPSWEPITGLGGKVKSWFDAEQLGTLSLTGSLLNSWTALVSGVVVSQSLSAAKPLYQPTGFGGRPMVWADGTDDFLALSPDPWAAGATPEELWVLTDQQAPIADALPRFAMAHGFGGSQGRRITRLASTDHLLGAVGDGAVIQTSTIAGGFLGRSLIRFVIKATEIDLYLNGAGKQTVAVVPNTTATHLRLFASANATASSFYLGGHNSVMRTELLSDSEAANNTNYFMARRAR